MLYNSTSKGKKKSGTVSKVFFSDESKEYIQDYLESRQIQGEQSTENTSFFTTTTGDRLSIREIQQMLKKYVKVSLKRSDISVHKLRSSFAMEFYKHEKNILVLQQRMGHKFINIETIIMIGILKKEGSRNIYIPHNMQENNEVVELLWIPQYVTLANLESQRN